MTVYKCSTLFLGHFLCVPRLTVLGCAGLHPLQGSPLAVLVPPGPGTERQASRNILILSPNPIAGLYSTLQLCSQTDLLCPSPLSPTKPCMAVMCLQPPALHLAPNIPGPSCVQPFSPSWGKENSPTAALVYKCSSKRFTFFFSWAGNWLQVFLLGLRAGKALQRERLHRGCRAPAHCTSSAARAEGNRGRFPLTHLSWDQLG